MLIGVMADVMPASAAVPGAPKITSAKAGNGAGNMTLKWAAPATDGGSPLTNYVYAYSTNGGTTWSSNIYLSTPFVRSVTGPLCPQVSSGCVFRVNAVNADGTGPASATKTALWTVPGKPQNFNSDAGPQVAEATLTFAAPATNGGYAIDYYEYQYSLNGTTWINGSGPIAGPTQVAWGCGVQITCSFRVRAHNALGFGLYSTADLSTEGVPRAVQNLNTTVDSLAHGTGVAVVDMNWDEPDTNGSAILYYDVQQCSGFPGCGVTNAYWNTAAITNVGSTLDYSPTCPAGVETCAFRIRAHNAFGDGPWRHKFMTSYAPYAPSAVTGAAPGTVVLNWTANRGPLNTQGRYKIYVCSTVGCTDDNDWSDTGLNPGTSTTATHACGFATVCKYRITFVYNSVDPFPNYGYESTMSALVTANGASEPGAPLNLTAVSSTSVIGRVNVAWQVPSYAGTSPITNYVLQRDTGSGYSTIATLSSATLSYNDLACGADVSCTYRVAAVNAVGTGANSNTATAIGANVPGAPQNPTAVPGTTSGAVDVAWQAPLTTGGNALLTYRIERKIGAGSFTLLTTVGSGTLSYTDVSCGASVSCQFRINATNSVGAGGYSSTATSLGADVPDAPTLSAVSNPTTSGAIDLTWVAPVNNGGQPITNYVIERNTGSGFAALTTVGNVLTYTDATCGALAICTYKVAAVNIIGQGAFSNQATATGASVPSAPQNPAAIPGTTLGAVDVTWQAPLNAGTQPVINYVVERKIGAGSFTNITTLSAATLSYSDTGCGASVTCDYRIAAISSVGQSPYSATVQTTGADVPGAPTSLAATSGTSLGAVDLSWIAPTNDGGRPITNYVVQRDTGSGFSTVATVGNVGTYTDTGCGANVSCSYRVAAVTMIGQGAYSNTDTALGASTPTATQTLVAATGSSLGAVDLTWVAPNSSGTHPITSYRIERKIGAGSFSLLTTVGNVLAYTDVTCGANVACTYQVAAINAIGTGAFSNSATATGADVLSAPQNLTAATGAASGEADLTWQAPLSNGGNPLLNYYLERDTGSGYSLIATLSSVTLSYIDTGCGALVSCSYRVRGDNVIGFGPYSNIASAVGASVPTAPVLTAATSTSALRYVNLSWTVPSTDPIHAITDYEYRVDSGSGFGAWTSLASVSVSFADLCGSSDHSATSCTYEVRAVNALGAGPASNSSTASSLIDNVAPAPTITAPAAAATTTGLPVISGTGGTDTGDGANVTVNVYSGAACSGAVVRTTVANISSGTWSWNLTPVLTTGQYSACATQTDWTTGPTNTGVSAVRTWDVASDPVVTLTNPVAGTLYDSQSLFDTAWPGSISGTASDVDSTVANVKVSIHRDATNLYWNGSTFSSASENLITASGTTSWSLAFAASNFSAGGSYTVHVTATDAGGSTNVNNTPANQTRSFNLDFDPNDTVFVATTGNDGNSGLTTALPKLTIGAGLTAAQSGGKSRVIVATGTYGQVNMTGGTYGNNKTVMGGFDANYKHAAVGASVVTVSAASFAVRVDAKTGIVLRQLTISGTNAGLAAGSSVYGLIVTNSGSATVERSTVTAAAGVAGTGGANGSGNAGTASNGGGGGGACGNCGTQGSQGSAGGGVGGRNGGSGGIGGAQGNNNGGGGTNGTASGAGGGNGGAGGNTNGSCNDAGGGQGGSRNTATSAGTAGSGGSAGTFTITGGGASGWAGGTNGTNGAAGSNGHGGGGGGGGGGDNGSFISCTGDAGAGGGGGGGGGGAGTGFGNGGAAGGGSFAIYVAGNASVTVTNITATAGNGGAGGAGGSGSAGTAGGNGGNGGNCDTGQEAGSGGGGGGGSGGGGAGGGGGGAGGPSIAVYENGTGTVTQSGTNSLNFGTAGAGGASGAGGAGGAGGGAGTRGNSGVGENANNNGCFAGQNGATGTAGQTGTAGPAGAAGTAVAVSSN